MPRQLKYPAEEGLALADIYPGSRTFADGAMDGPSCLRTCAIQRMISASSDSVSFLIAAMISSCPSACAPKPASASFGPRALAARRGGSAHVVLQTTNASWPGVAVV